MELRLKIVIIKMLLFNFHLIEKNLMTLNRPHVGLSFGSSVGLFILFTLFTKQYPFIHGISYYSLPFGIYKSRSHIYTLQEVGGKIGESEILYQPDILPLAKFFRWSFWELFFGSSFLSHTHNYKID